MTNEIIFPSSAITAFLTAGILATLIPIAAAVIFKLRNKDVKLRYLFIGAVTFPVFALILEQILHTFMLPLVMGSTAAYVIYGTLAAGVFEETGRFVAFKLFCKNEQNPKASLLYGIGHGGIEAIVLCGITMLSYAIMAITINTVGAEQIMSAVPAEQTELAMAQLTTLTEFTMVNGLISVLERVIAMTLHISLSVVVFASIKQKGKLWLFPAAILLHAIFDVPAALYQRGVVTLPICEVILFAETIVVVFIAMKIYKSLKSDYKAAEAEKAIQIEQPANAEAEQTVTSEEL